MKVRPIVGKQAFSDDTFAPNHYEKINISSEDVKASMAQTLAVQASGKLTTTWGKLKSDSRSVGF